MAIGEGMEKAIMSLTTFLIIWLRFTIYIQVDKMSMFRTGKFRPDYFFIVKDDSVWLDKFSYPIILPTSFSYILDLDLGIPLSGVRIIKLVPTSDEDKKYWHKNRIEPRMFDGWNRDFI